MILPIDFFFQIIKIKLNLRTCMTLKSSVVIFQALEPLRPQWPLQPQQPPWPHFIKKNYISWPQQPLREKLLIFNMIFYDYIFKKNLKNIKIKLNSRTLMILKSWVMIFQALGPLQPP